MYKYPTVTIVTPSYNSAHTIWKTILSIQNQKYPYWDMIIVDEPATDDCTEKLVHEFRFDKRIKYIKNKYNQCASGGRRTGTEMAEGDYIGYIDSDNTVSSDWLALMVERFKNYPTVSYIYPSRNFRLQIIEDGVYKSVKENCSLTTPPSVEALWSFAFDGDPNGLVHKRDLLHRVTWDDSISVYEDFEFGLQLTSVYPEEMGFIDQVLVNYVRLYGASGGVCSKSTYDKLLKSLDYIKKKHGNSKYWGKYSTEPFRMKYEEYTDLRKREYTPIQRIKEKYGFITNVNV